MIHTYIESSKIQFFCEILNSHENTACFVFMVIFIIRGGNLIYNEILFDYKYDKYLGAFRFVLASRNNGTIRPLFVCAEANYESGLRAAATYHANEGVSVK